MNQTSRSTYFDQFPGFEPDPHRSLEDEFRRLARFQRWGPKGKRFAKERETCLLTEFASQLGPVERSKKLDDWQALCVELRIKAIPDSITQCKKALSTKVHVNLVDLLDSRRLGTAVTIFKTKHDLVRYTMSTGKFFPKKKAKKEGLLRILLRELV